MARIRSIKPEFPHNPAMGKVSRDARLLFIQLWTLADDAGRLRGNSRLLASLLYPYDNDVSDKIPDWLDELENQDCVVQYTCEKQDYIQLSNFLEYQKIDKPTPSKLPGQSRGVARSREESEKIALEGKGVEGKGMDITSPSVPRVRLEPTGSFDQHRFDQLWTRYPKRAGSNSRKDASKAIQARLTDGVSWEEIEAGTERYRAYCDHAQSTGTVFVMQAVRFYGPAEHFKEPFEILHPLPEFISGADEAEVRRICGILG